MKDDETFTREELESSMSRLTFTTVGDLSSQLVADIIAHREPEYEVGEIYQDTRGRRFIRRADDLWPWVCITWVNAGRVVIGQVGGFYPDNVPVRPLRKLVPVHEKGSYDDGFLHGFTAGQEASDA